MSKNKSKGSTHRRVVELSRRVNARYDADFFNLYKPSSEYDPRKILSKFETYAIAERRRDQVLDVLAGGDDAERAVRKKIKNCGEGHRCHSAACDICRRSFRIRWAGIAAELIASDDSPWFVVSLVPPELVFSLGKLKRFDPAKFKDRLRNQLARSKITGAPAFGGIDFAVQVIKYGRPVWHPHMYFLVRGYSEKAIGKVLKKYYPPDHQTSVPIKIRQLRKENATDLMKVVTYTFKSVFKQRIPCTDAKGNADTEEDDLTDLQWRELAPLLDKWGFTGRLFRRGMGEESRFQVIDRT